MKGVDHACPSHYHHVYQALEGTEIAQAMAGHCHAVRQEPGCRQFEVFQSDLDPDKLAGVEVWDGRAAPAARAGQRHPPTESGARRPPNRRY